VATMPATGEVFIGRGCELHVAPEGIALTTGAQAAPNFAEYAEISSADVGGGGTALTIRFRSDRPAWVLTGFPAEQAEWAATMIEEAVAAAQQRADPIFSDRIEFGRLQEQIRTFGDPSAPRVAPLLDLILAQAILHEASDVHLEPTAKEIQVRYRIDGMLFDVGTIPLALRERLMGRVKVIGAMVTYRTDVPQEGRSTAEVGGRRVDARISVIPTIHGEKATVRLFDPALAVRPLGELGLAESDLASIEELLSRPQGTILLTGPAGSGKTTTMYSGLAHIHEQRRSLASICTIEDPVEHDLGIVGQTQVDPACGLTFAAGLRTILRQDPEVIMVGEVRDAETAGIAIQAGLTGHLILSTVHARSAAGVFARLIDIGVEPFLVASSVSAVVAQRLVRRVCDACGSTTARPDAAVWPKLGIAADEGARWTTRAGAGCGKCGNTGYRGRTGVFQVLPVDARLRSLVMKGLPIAELEQEVARLGIGSLREAALAKVREGITTPDEVLRVLGSVDADL
jgi:type II secretory ATPase GspE/PulE/Tfp pilus assembly ATPase PilB-like protein